MRQFRTKQQAFDAGVLVGKAEAERLYEQRLKSADAKLNARAAQLQALEAVTKLVSVAGQSLQSLAQVFDNGPRS